MKLIADTSSQRASIGRSSKATRLLAAYEETGDAVMVLNEGDIFPAAVTHLIAARDLIAQAQRTNGAPQRRATILLAIEKLVQGRNTVATMAP